MDTNRIRNLATGVRDSLRAEVSARLDAALAEGSRARLEEAGLVRDLEADVAAHGREEVVDRAAYTWFNRLCALRYMDARGHTPVGVVTPRAGQTMPAVLADAAAGLFDPELGAGEGTRARVAALLSGAEASGSATEEAYALLLRAACERYAGPMPYLFSGGVASPLLMPRGLLAQGSLLDKVVGGMDDEACESVEVLGWLYQFYVAERKDEVFQKYRRRGKAEAADIAPATQLFTPDWIVRYLTENSLGRLWMLNYPESDLAESMEYYVAPEGDEPHIEVASASEIRVLDPACGSGHILTYAFDLLFQMYEEEGWPEEEIPAMILENNLSGLEIDRRAAEIASFALEMKALERDPSFLERGVDADVHVLEPVRIDSPDLQLVPQLAERRGLLEAMARLDQVGSLYVPDPGDAPAIEGALEALGNGDLLEGALKGKLRTMLSNVRALSRTFHCVVANPPYMGSGNMNAWLSGWVKKNYPDEKGDLFAAFILRNCLFGKLRCELGFMTPYVWMFIATYDKLRRMIINEKTITSLIQLEYSGFAEATVPVCTFTLCNTHFKNYRGGYVRLADFVGAARQAPKALEAIQHHDCGWFYRADAEAFKKIPGWPIAYWAGAGMLNSFNSDKFWSDIATFQQGLSTGDNNLMLRRWWEPNISGIGFNLSNRQAALKTLKRWFPCHKGGPYRKWYGNLEYVVDWEKDGNRSKQLSGSRRDGLSVYFCEGFTWSRISSSNISARYSPQGFIPTSVGSLCTSNNAENLYCALGFINSTVSDSMLTFLAPALHFTCGPLRSMPFFDIRHEHITITNKVQECISLSRADWDSFETSWDFKRHPLLPASGGGTALLAERFDDWEAECRGRFDNLRANEEELNRIFAGIYHMEGEVPIEVLEDKVSVRLADRARDARSLVSYAIGCMLGRYSDEADGLVLADQGATLDDFRAKVPDATFLPDAQNVLPVLGGEWFTDDASSGLRRWLAHAFGEDTLDENVAWLEESLGKPLRAYLCRDFYADHLKAYQKRPIYWMFQSPKKTFQCLVYMHRYDEGTVGTVLTGYLRPLEEKLRARLRELEAPGATAAEVRQATKLRNQVTELEAWERDVVYPLAQERVTIDLDDGVKVNYNRFPRALAKVAGLSEWR